MEIVLGFAALNSELFKGRSERGFLGVAAAVG
jgi:hypothetical protein